MRIKWLGRGAAAVTEGRAEATGMWVFYALTFGGAWLVWLPVWLAERTGQALPVPPAALVLLGAAAPSLAALVVVQRQAGGGGLRQLLLRALRWRVAPAWYGLALVGPAAVMLLAMAVHVALGGVAPDYAAPGARWLLVAVNLALIVVIGGPLGEELGWRGLALPALEARLGRWWAAGALGVIWAVWHWPLFYISASAQHTLPFWLYALQAVPLSVLLAWVYHGTGESLLLVMLLHGAVNTWAGPLQIAPEAAGSARPLALVTALTWALALVVVARHRRPAATRTPPARRLS